MSTATATVAASGQEVALGKRKSKGRAPSGRASGTAWAMLAPAAILMLVFLIVPIVLTLSLAFTDARLISPTPAKFTGLIGNALDAAGLGSTLSTNAVEYSKETRVSDFPIEQGGFASYNKVEAPAAPTVTLCLTGSEKNRRTFLDAIDAACKSTDLYSVVTPEVTYIDYSVERYNYQRRNSKGATLLLVEITLKEIRQVSAAYSISDKGQVDAPQDAGAAPQVDNGKVQAQTPKPSTLKSLADKLPGLADKASSYLQGLVK